MVEDNPWRMEGWSEVVLVAVEVVGLGHLHWCQPHLGVALGPSSSLATSTLLQYKTLIFNLKLRFWVK